MKAALVTGITGQDSVYLAQLLINDGYSVVGCYEVKRRPMYIVDRKVNFEQTEP